MNGALLYSLIVKWVKGDRDEGRECVCAKSIQGVVS
jgi:hypothetical protein